MKRSWFGLGLLIFLLAAALLVTWTMGRIHEPIAGDLTAAGEAALSSDWTQAETLSRRAKASWVEQMLLRSCFADHNPMEEIDACFAQLEIYLRMKEETAFAASCGEIARRVKAMGEAHGLKWENIF